MPQTDKSRDLTCTQNRELSWLKFNMRVLQEAQDVTVPLMERLRFISIFTSNLDEFFMVRVGSLYDLSQVTPKAKDNKSGKTPAQQLELIFQAVRPMIQYRDRIYLDLCRDLESKGVKDIPYDQLQNKDKSYIQDYYKNNIRPLLSPQIIDRSHPFPHLKNKALYAAALLREKDKELLGIVGVPDSVPPILFLPGDHSKFVRTETILQAHLKKIFKIYHVAESSVISVTRNADISYDEEKFDEDSLDFRKHMSKLLRRRERLTPVRLEMQGAAETLCSLLQEKLKLTDAQTYVCHCPLNLKYVYQVTACDKSLFYTPHEPIYPAFLDPSQPLWDQFQQQDTLLFYPYESMQPFLDLLKQSAVDPKVLSIQITIYRLASKSAVAKALCTAAEHGKSVTVLVELRARFDEQNNIKWAQELEEAGCQIIYGAEGYKCHSKICLITRRGKGGKLSYLTQVGTGNYNEKTAALYTDFSLLTSDPVIAEDAVSFFQNMLLGDLNGSYQKLLVAPNSMKDVLLRLIDGEIARGSRGHIIVKCNSLTERDLIDRLAQASQMGVKVELIIRGICCMIPGIAGRTDHITVTSIVGRFLEHSRVYCFGDGDLRQMYISSADFMTRNQMRRVEIACPIESPELKNWLSQYLEVLLKDNVKARRLLPTGDYIEVYNPGEERISSQEYFFNHLPERKPVVVKKSKWQTLRRAFQGLSKGKKE